MTIEIFHKDSSYTGRLLLWNSALRKGCIQYVIDYATGHIKSGIQVCNQAIANLEVIIVVSLSTDPDIKISLFSVSVVLI
jgi:hypothetical protein